MIPDFRSPFIHKMHLNRTFEQVSGINGPSNATGCPLTMTQLTILIQKLKLMVAKAKMISATNPTALNKLNLKKAEANLIAMEVLMNHCRQKAGLPLIKLSSSLCGCSGKSGITGPDDISYCQSVYAGDQASIDACIASFDDGTGSTDNTGGGLGNTIDKTLSLGQKAITLWNSIIGKSATVKPGGTTPNPGAPAVKKGLSIGAWLGIGVGAAALVYVGVKLMKPKASK